MAGFSPPLHEQDFSIPGMNPPVIEIAEEKRSKRNPQQLDFEAAMDEFRTMFPGLEVELIESVLRANSGGVDDTIDQLLTMTLDCGEKSKSAMALSPPQLPPKPAGSLRSSNERLQCAEEYTPALPPREGSLKRAKKKVDPVQPSTTAILYNTPTTKYNTEWNGMCIPMLGKLPSNFLRIIATDAPPPRPPKAVASKQRSHSMKSKFPRHLAEQPTISKTRANTLKSRPHPSSLGSTSQQKVRGVTASHLTTASGDRLSSNALKRQIEVNQRRLQENCETNDQDGDTERFLEDERLALIMQNEEFLRELKRNEDFMRTLEFERDMLATRLAVEQKKNRQLTHPLSGSDRQVPNWMAPRPSERDDNSITGSLSPGSDTGVANSLTPAATQALESSSLYTEDINPSLVPMDRTDKTDVHDFKDQLKSMGATSKKKFALLAKKFFTSSRRRRKGTARIVRDVHGASTLNLLDDNDDEDLIDASTSQHMGGTDQVLFEPLPDAWTSHAPSNSSESLGTESREHFL